MDPVISDAIFGVLHLLYFIQEQTPNAHYTYKKLKQTLERGI